MALFYPMRANQHGPMRIINFPEDLLAVIQSPNDPNHLDLSFLGRDLAGAELNAYFIGLLQEHLENLVEADNQVCITMPMHFLANPLLYDVLITNLALIQSISFSAAREEPIDLDS